MLKNADDLVRLLSERHDRTPPACLILPEQDAIALYQRAHFVDRHVDHVNPLGLHGPHDISNLAVMHSACNIQKRDKSPASMGLLF